MHSALIFVNVLSQKKKLINLTVIYYNFQIRPDPCGVALCTVHVQPIFQFLEMRLHQKLLNHLLSHGCRYVSFVYIRFMHILLFILFDKVILTGVH